MMACRSTLILLVGQLSALPTRAPAQTFPTDDPVLQRIWEEGMTDRSQVASLAQVLMDSIGPRLTGSPGHLSAIDWVASKYQQWGIPVRKENFGTWRGWTRGYTHIDLIAPRVRSLEGLILAWSPGTKGPVEGDVVLFPDVATEAEFKAWLPKVKGKFVMISAAEPTCRPDENWEKLARPESVERMKTARTEAQRAWQARMGRAGRGASAALEAAGAAAVLTTRWSA